ncbi:uncharacterized protein AMSG_04740 [Thecamonas trahens ATCC 50062]|uniref:DUF7630 domain-containing protein n=1 Tax=Thecamonas trahens ATCC 50062 TaxID=461836 RepID=A0A0L0DA79_THETB|nr:hypothetical protein AMSG_04740 [Thecamonas trahens ATCC 50062]KNC48996.1 hypothetical protein AMSG_04740 [Thecamonas trahens ATCC 50062]|eukprot:XP_013758409.1 hypothetical protein AMSG_04740 [Thecamonas trahens ATCC 50062]
MTGTVVTLVVEPLGTQAATVDVLLDPVLGRPNIPQCKPEVPLSPVPIVAVSSGRGVICGRVDSDAVDDVVVARRGSSDVQLFRGNGVGGFSSVTVGTGIANIVGVAIGKLSSDSLVDVAVATLDEVLWFRQTAGPSFTAGVNVHSTSEFDLDEVAVGDVDSDGDDDIVVTTHDSRHLMFWMENTDGAGSFASAATITTYGSYLQSVLIVDIDGNAINDILWSDVADGTLTWMKDGTSGVPANLVSLGAGSVFSSSHVRAGDVNGDGMIDLVFAFSWQSAFGWLQSSDGAGGFYPPRAIEAAVDSPGDLTLADIDADGDLDIALTHVETKDVVWHENVDGGGRFGPRLVVGTLGLGFLHVCAGNYASGPSLDFVSLDDTVLQRWPTSSAVAPSATVHVAASGMLDSFEHAPADINADGFVDVVVGTSSGALWFANFDGAGNFGPAQPVFDAQAVRYIKAVDMDGDGDTDVVAWVSSGPVWAANNGVGRFGPRQPVVTTPSPPYAHFDVVDVNGDGARDFVAVSQSDTLVWALNAGDGSFPLPTSVLGVGADVVVLRDINSDGAPDLVVIDTMTDELTWFENEFPSGRSFAASAVIYAPTGLTEQLLVDDIDSDGRNDILVMDTSSTVVKRITQGGVPGTFNTPTAVATLKAAGAIQLSLGDMDGDGHVDLVAIMSNSDVDMALNSGSGTFGAVLTLASASMTTFASLDDVDGDGDIDVITSSGSLGQFGWVARLLRGPMHVFAPTHRGLRTRDKACETGSRGSFECVRASLRTTSRCTHDTVNLPPAQYNCSRDSHALVSNAMTIAGSAGTVFECGSAGVLFHVGPDASGMSIGELVLANMTVRGTGVARTSLIGGPGVRVGGSGARLVLDGMTFEGCSAAPRTDESDFSVGRGGAVLVLSGASLEARRSTFKASSASSGGALHVRGVGSSATLEACTFRDNEAGNLGGSVTVATGASLLVADSLITSSTAINGGGGLYAANGASLTLRGATTIEDNTVALAGLGGGVLIVAPATVQLDGTSIRRNSAGGSGGGLAVVAADLHVELASAQTSVEVPVASGEGPLSGPAPPTIVLVDVRLEMSEANYLGGNALVCGARVSLVGSGTLMSGGVSGADRRANDVFLCAGAGVALSQVGRSDRAKLPWLRADAAAFGTLGTAVMAGPLASMAWASGPSGSLEPGLSASGAVRGVDWLGQPLVEPRIVLRMRYEADPALATVGSSSMALESTAVSLPDLTVQIVASAIGDGGGASLIPLTAHTMIEAGGVSSRGLAVPALRATVNITGCRAGSGTVAGSGSATSVVVCAECGEGTQQSAGPLAQCVALSACPANAVRLGGDAMGACSCERNFWVQDGVIGADGCLPCPSGGVCTGGSAQPVSGPGFFPDETDPTLFVACPTASACLLDGQCAPGYTARLCAQCAPNYYRLGSSCRKCAAGRNAAIVACLVVGLLVITAALLMFNLAQSLRYKFAAAMIGLNALQISAMYGKLDLAWGGLAQVYFDVASAVNVDFELTSPECAAAAGTDTWALKWGLTLALPVFAAAAVVAVAPLMLLPGKLRRADNLAQLMGGCGRTLFQLLVLLYLPLARAAMAPFGCRREVGGRWVLDADPARSCYNSAWWVGLFPVAMAAVLCYAIGVPAVVWLVLRRQREVLGDELTFTIKFGFLVGRFVPTAWWFETAIMARKLGVVLCMALFFTDKSKANAGVVVLVSALGQLIFQRPYGSPLHNGLSVAVLAATTLVLYSGTFDDGGLRSAGIHIGIVSNVALIIGGVMADFWLIARREKRAEAGFDADMAGLDPDLAREDLTTMTNDVHLDNLMSDVGTPLASQATVSYVGSGPLGTSQSPILSERSMLGSAEMIESGGGGGLDSVV